MIYLKIRQKHQLIFFFIDTINTEVIEKNNEYLKSKLEIPVITSSNKEISNEVNTKIKNDILSYYNESLKEAENFQEDFETNNNFVANVSYEIKKNTERFISLNIYRYKYSGGAHGTYEYIPYNIDMINGKFLKLDDLFKDGEDYKGTINKEIEKEVKKLEKEQNAEGVYDFKGIKDNQKFYISNDNLIIFFDLYEIAPYAAGIPEFTINVNLLNDYIKDNYKILFQ